MSSHQLHVSVPNAWLKRSLLYCPRRRPHPLYTFRGSHDHTQLRTDQKTSDEDERPKSVASPLKEGHLNVPFSEIAERVASLLINGSLPSDTDGAYNGSSQKARREKRHSLSTNERRRLRNIPLLWRPTPSTQKPLVGRVEGTPRASFLDQSRHRELRPRVRTVQPDQPTPPLLLNNKRFAVYEDLVRKICVDHNLLHTAVTEVDVKRIISKYLAEEDSPLKAVDPNTLLSDIDRYLKNKRFAIYEDLVRKIGVDSHRLSEAATEAEAKEVIRKCLTEKDSASESIDPDKLLGDIDRYLKWFEDQPTAETFGRARNTRPGMRGLLRRYSTLARPGKEEAPETREKENKEQHEVAREENKAVAEAENPPKKKTVAEMDKELQEKMAGHAGDGGEAGVELENGQPVAMKRGVKANMFRYI